VTEPKCELCDGSGQYKSDGEDDWNDHTAAAWSSAHGGKPAPCPRCRGTGGAPAGLTIKEAMEIEEQTGGKELLALIHGVEIGDYKACSDAECLICSIIACPLGEPLHFHHDGCPADCGK
jgi:hypothetical protein